MAAKAPTTAQRRSSRIANAAKGATKCSSGTEPNSKAKRSSPVKPKAKAETKKDGVIKRKSAGVKKSPPKKKTATPKKSTKAAAAKKGSGSSGKKGKKEEKSLVDIASDVVGKGVEKGAEAASNVVETGQKMLGRAFSDTAVCVSTSSLINNARRKCC